MDRKYACYCGLYCENCAVKVKVEPAAEVLYEEMERFAFAYAENSNDWRKNEI